MYSSSKTLEIMRYVLIMVRLLKLLNAPSNFYLLGLNVKYLPIEVSNTEVVEDPYTSVDDVTGLWSAMLVTSGAAASAMI